MHKSYFFFKVLVEVHTTVDRKDIKKMTLRAFCLSSERFKEGLTLEA